MQIRVHKRDTTTTHGLNKIIQCESKPAVISSVIRRLHPYVRAHLIESSDIMHFYEYQLYIDMRKY